MSDIDPEQSPHEGDTKQPLSLKETLVIVLSGHLGVRKRTQRTADFARAQGIHVFIAAVCYFAIIVAALVLLVIYIAS